MKTFFRIDEWYKNGSGSKFYFEQTETEAMAHVSGMSRVALAETEGQEHTTIVAFKAETCDMEGWDYSVSNSLTSNPEYFI